MKSIDINIVTLLINSLFIKHLFRYDSLFYNSKYLCKLVKAFKTPDNKFMIASEYAELGDLRKYCTSKPDLKLTETLVKEWMARIALGLNELHTRNIIHRDIKPANIFVFSEHDVRLGDYGQSKIIESSLKQKHST